MERGLQFALLRRVLETWDPFRFAQWTAFFVADRCPLCDPSTQIIRSHGSLLTSTEDASLSDDLLRRGIKTEAVAIRAQSSTCTDDRIASLAHFVGGGIGGDLGSGFRA